MIASVNCQTKMELFKPKCLELDPQTGWKNVAGLQGVRHALLSINSP